MRLGGLGNLPGSRDISGVLVKVQSQGKTGALICTPSRWDLFFLRCIYFCLHCLHCCTLAFSSCAEWGPFPLSVPPPTVAASLVAACELSAGSVVMVLGPSCPSTCAITFLEQGLNLRLLHWQAHS